MTTGNNFIFVKSDYKLIKINISEILFLSGMRDYTQIYLKNKQNPVVTLINLKEFEKKFEDQNFVRVHRSYIISLGQVDSISKNEICIGTHNIPIGNSFRDKLHHAIEKSS